MLISNLSRETPVERLLFLMIWLGTRIVVLKTVFSKSRSIRHFVSSLAQWPKQFSKKAITLLSVK